jgi:hypothetical protein
MTISEKRHWIVVLAYSGLLGLSLVLFFADANRRIGRVAWNALFQAFAPTIGTGVLLLGTLVQMVRARISVLNGIAAIVLIVAVSFVCLALTIPIMMGV